MWFKLKTDPCDFAETQSVHIQSRHPVVSTLVLRNETKQHFYLIFMHSFLVFLLCQIIADKCVILLDAACPRGRYGVQCRSFCTCANGGVCDPVNGTCRCGLGWTGQHCEKGEQAHNAISSMELQSNINRKKREHFKLCNWIFDSECVQFWPQDDKFTLILLFACDSLCPRLLWCEL